MIEAKIQSSLDVWLYQAEVDCVAAVAGYTTSEFIDKFSAFVIMLPSAQRSVYQYNKYLRKN